MKDAHYSQNSVSENGILKQEEFRRYKGRSIDLKFRQQLFLGIGGATVFGLAGAAGAFMLETIKTASTAAVFAGMSAPALAWAGLAALAVVGLASIYIGSKYLSESILLDQDFNAKKIGYATRGAVPTLEQEKTAPMTPPGMASGVDTEETPRKAWASSIASAEKAGNFVERVAASTAQQSSALSA